MTGGNGGCFKAPDFETEDERYGDEARRNIEDVRQYLERVWNRRDLSAIDELVAENYVRHRADRVLHGRQGLREVVEATHRACPDLRVQVEELMAEDGRVMARLTVSGTDEGGVVSIRRPTRRRVRVHSMAVFRLERGKIAESWHLFDEPALLAQLGQASRPRRRR